MTSESARTLLIDELRRYLVGPLTDDELISHPERPFDRYHLGFLAPAGAVLDPEEDDQESSGDSQEPETGSDDSTLVLANMQKQSAFGMTFSVSGDCKELFLRADWATYEAVPRLLDNNMQVRDWQRHSCFTGNMLIALEKADGIPHTLFEQEGVAIRVTIRRPSHSQSVGNQVITVSMLNLKPAEREGRHQDNNLYQCSLKVAAPDDAPVFTARPGSDRVNDEEFWTHELLYRDVRQFAIGHGCAVEWTVDARDPSRATAVRTEWMPAVEVPKASALVLGEEPWLRLDYLDRPEVREEITAALDRLPSLYGEWIEQRQAMVEAICSRFPAGQPERIREAAQRNLAACECACRRIAEGVRLLRRDNTVWEAFCLANRAMAMAMRASRPDGPPPAWRAFQLAFILLALPSTLDNRHEDRRVLDLIWFPTGGGKTEAYLGLSALYLLHRRLAHPGSEAAFGTAILTRYTLRLLTIQQLERTARMVCACEKLRRGDAERLGEEPFTIGLFVGSGATPNTLADAQERLEGRGDDQVTTLPLPVCPWCNASLTTDHQQVEETRLLTRCPSTKCEFRTGLPVAVVDEELYQHPPSIVIGTIDKFAMLPWEPRIRHLFGLGPQRRLPPGLIIQDELHLIGDALGTVTALYETAIDYLCSRDDVAPKIIGSTATIRRADEQVRRLFVREAAQFPPSGTEAGDSFFYREEREAPGRCYLGVHAQGRSPKHTLARVLGTLAQCVQEIQDPRIRDQYYTLVAYFNSMRELGGALVLAEDDVPRYIAAMPLSQNAVRRQLKRPMELTSQVKSTMIPEYIRQLQTPLPELNTDLDRETVDIVLSTNMISVGMDIDRLGLMIINGQPKTTAEYIQASSRVGRPSTSAGLVVTLYNWTRPRDRSHYERFRAYHRTFYRFVESTSVTPFSARARDRALHAVLIALARSLIGPLTDNQGATRMADKSVSEPLKQLVEVICQRAAQVMAEEAEETRAHLDALLEDLTGWAESEQHLTWRKEKNKVPVMFQAGQEFTSTGLSTLMSMRDVEPPTPVKLTRIRTEQA